MSEKSAATEVTMSDLRRACAERLDHAVKTNEKGVSVLKRDDGERYEKFETPAGLMIRRYAGLLSIECDFGELDGGVESETRIEFIEGEEDPIEVITTTMGPRGTTSNTVAKKDQDALAVELVKYVTLIV